MLESQRITQQVNEAEVRMDALATEVNEIVEVRDSEAGYDTYVKERRDKVRDLNKATGAYEELVLKLRSELRKEDVEAQALMAANTDTTGAAWTAELRELRQAAQATNIGHYMRAAETGRDVTDAALEYKQHVLGEDAKPEEFPLEMLLDRDEFFNLDARVMEEMRAEVTGAAAGTASMLSFADRLFATSDGAYLGAMYPAVGPGRHAYPIISGSTVAASYARGAAETPAGGLSIVNADPERIQHSYEYSSTDELTVPGVATYLAADLRMSLMAGLDNKVIDDILATLTDPGVTIVVETLNALLGRFGAGVDGKGAMDVRDVRIMVGIGTYKHVSALTTANIGQFMERVPHDRFRASSHIAAASSDDQAAIVYRTGAPASLKRLIAPIWRRGELLRDRARLQLQGTVTLTGVMHADVILVAQDLHDAISFHLA